MKKIAILYICTGRYSYFWNNFYLSSENFFLKNSHKEYFVFTDGRVRRFSDRVHRIKQKKLGWPFDTLFRFKMFSSIKKELAGFDYVFFLNANMVFVQEVDETILPTEKEKLLAVKHPGFYNRIRSEYTYETNPNSLAFITDSEGENYYMGGFNGGILGDYLELIEHLDRSIDEDLKNEIIAKWHDESHLNKYLLRFKDLKVLDSSYGFPEGWAFPFSPKVVVLDKEKLGGHEWLRSNQKSFVSKFFSYIKNGLG